MLEITRASLTRGQSGHVPGGHEAQGARAAERIIYKK